MNGQENLGGKLPRRRKCDFSWACTSEIFPTSVICVP